jgi:hypothetical protein
MESTEQIYIAVKFQNRIQNIFGLPALWPHLDPLQAATSLHVLRGWSPPPRMSGKEHSEYPKLLQL